MKPKIAYQTTKHGCGIASVKNALIDAAHDDGFRYLPEPDSSDVAPSLAELIRYGENHGLALEGYRIDLPPGRGWDPGKSILLLGEEGSLHAVYCSSFGPFLCRVINPEKGRCLVSRKRLLASFSGVYLTVGPFRGVTKPKMPRPRRFGHGLLFALIALSIVSLAFGGLLLGTSLPKIYSLISFCVGCAGLVAFLCLASAFSKDFSRRHRSLLSIQDPKERRRRFRLLFGLRSLLFGETLRWFALAVGILCAWAVLAVRDFALGIAVLIAACLLCVSWLTDVPVAKRETKRLEREEEEFQATDLALKENDGLLSSIERRSNRLSRYIIARGMLVMVLSLSVSFFSALLRSSLSFDVVMGSAIAIFLFLTQLDRLFSSSGVFLDKKKAEQAFLVLWTEEQNRKSTLPMK